MRVELEIEAKGRVFSEEMFPVGELARILRGSANQVHEVDVDSLDGWEQQLRYSYGNVISHVVINPVHLI